jgi:D-galactarolactone cycloisomerase
MDQRVNGIGQYTTRLPNINVMTRTASQIVRIDGYEVRCALPEIVGNSSRFFDHRSALIVAITTADGIAGWGETWAMPAAAGAVIRSGLGRAVLGQDAGAPRPVWDAMTRTLGYDRRGVSHMAMSAIDIAVWDAAARSANVPIAMLLGGALRDKVQAYVSGPFLKPGADPYRDFDADIGSYLDAGFRAMKLRMGVAPKTDAGRLAGVRKRVGDDFPLMVDLNEGATYRSALVYGEAFRESGLVWLEEPIRHDNLPAYIKLAQALPMALAGGEALIGTAPFRDYLTAGALDIIQPDLALCGGFSEALRIAALADAFEVPLIPHVWGTGINFCAALQFAMVLPEYKGPGIRYPLFEYDYSYNPLRDAFGRFPVGTDGTVSPPPGPGLGIDIEPGRFASHVVDQWSIDA